jgi:membrane protease YdiL (CAAX protease family)
MAAQSHDNLITSDSVRSRDYWSDARTPLASLCFLVPWIVFYEFGVLSVGPDEANVLRNGADYWMRSLLARIGIGQVVLPLLVLGLLLIWHIVRHHPWQIRPETQLGMLAESVLLAGILVVVGHCHDFCFRQLESSSAAGSVALLSMSGPVHRAVSFIGAGVYEEFMFRLLLVPVAFMGFRLFEFPPRWAAAMAAISTSFLFALAHHVGPSAETFHLFAFSFRAAAGLFFATVFLTRGFGITVGCHAAYDLLVGIVLAGG